MRAAIYVLYMANTTRRSIELEPKTLNQGQLSQARKVAEDVMQKMEPKEASCLFTEGLLEDSEEEVIEELDEEGEKGVEKQVGCIEKIDEMIEEKACNISLYSSVVVDSPSDHQLHIHQHEPLSAPF